jgi:hypothetical protein
MVMQHYYCHKIHKKQNSRFDLFETAIFYPYTELSGFFSLVSKIPKALHRLLGQGLLLI